MEKRKILFKLAIAAGLIGTVGFEFNVLAMEKLSDSGVKSSINLNDGVNQSLSENRLNIFNFRPGMLSYDSLGIEGLDDKNKKMLFNTFASRITQYFYSLYEKDQLKEFDPRLYKDDIELLDWWSEGEKGQDYYGRNFNNFFKITTSLGLDAEKTDKLLDIMKSTYEFCGAQKRKQGDVPTNDILLSYSSNKMPEYKDIYDYALKEGFGDIMIREGDSKEEIERKKELMGDVDFFYQNNILEQKRSEDGDIIRFSVSFSPQLFAEMLKEKGVAFDVTNFRDLYCELWDEETPLYYFSHGSFMHDRSEDRKASFAYDDMFEFDNEIGFTAGKVMKKLSVNKKYTIKFYLNKESKKKGEEPIYSVDVSPVTEGKAQMRRAQNFNILFWFKYILANQLNKKNVKFF